jgi:hypothetical protein
MWRLLWRFLYIREASVRGNSSVFQENLIRNPYVWNTPSCMDLLYFLKHLKGIFTLVETPLEIPFSQGSFC